MKILVIDTETTGFNYKKDAVLEIGGVLIDSDKKSIIPAFHYIINEGKPLKEDMWIFKHSSLTLKDVLEKGIKWETIKDTLQTLFNKYLTTAFNSAFDMGFLKERGFVFPLVGADPMLVARDILRIPHPTYGLKYPSVQECLDYFKIVEIEPHRAFRDANLEAQIILRMFERSYYKL